MHLLDALLETFTWVGLGAGVLFLFVALVLRLVDGSWQPTRVLLEDGPHGRVAHWFGADGGVGAAPLSHEQQRALAGRDEIDAFTREGTHDRFRLERRSPAARAFAVLAIVLVGIGILCAVLSIAMIFVRG